jgi:hypothetical protein
MFNREPVFWINLVKALVALAVVFGVQVTGRPDDGDR